VEGAHNTAAITVLGAVGLMFFGIGWLIALIWAFIGQTVFSGLFNQQVINAGVDIIYGASEVKGDAAYVPITAALLSLQQIEPLRTDLNTVVVHECVLQREEYN